MTATAKTGWVDHAMVWLPVGVAIILGVYAYDHWNDSVFVQHSPNQYGRWILTVFTVGLGGTFIGLGCLIIEILKNQSFRSWATVVSLFLLAGLVCGGFLLANTVQADKPGTLDVHEDILLIVFAASSLAAVAVKVAQEGGQFWTARLLAVEIPAAVTIITIVFARRWIYHDSNASFTAWLTAQEFHLGKENALKALVNAKATVALRDSFWVGVSFGVIGVQLLTSTIAATAIELWRLLAEDQPAK